MNNIKMIELKPSNRSLVIIVTLLFLVLGFTYYSISKDIGTEPEVILMGNPTEIAPSLQAKLPTGYSWITKEQIPTDFAVYTGNLKEDVLSGISFHDSL